MGNIIFSIPLTNIINNISQIKMSIYDRIGVLIDDYILESNDNSWIDKIKYIDFRCFKLHFDCSTDYFIRNFMPQIEQLSSFDYKIPAFFSNIYDYVDIRQFNPLWKNKMKYSQWKIC